MGRDEEIHLSDSEDFTRIERGVSVLLFILKSHRSLSGIVQTNLAVKLGTRKVFSFKLTYCLQKVPLSSVICKFYHAVSASAGTQNVVSANSM